MKRDTENKHLWDMWGCLRWIDHVCLTTDKFDMSFLCPPCSVSQFIHEGTVSSGPCVSYNSQSIRHLGALEEHWPWLALCFVLFPSPKSRVTVEGQDKVTGGSCLLWSSLVSDTQFSACARVHSLKCAMCLLRVADPRLSWSYPMWAAYEPRKSSLATVNQLRPW